MARRFGKRGLAERDCYERMSLACALEQKVARSSRERKTARRRKNCDGYVVRGKTFDRASLCEYSVSDYAGF